MASETEISRAADPFSRAVRWLALLGGLVLLFMVGLTVVDVGLRKFANAPIFGAQNISELALLVVVFFAMAYCGQTKGHVAVDLIGSAAGPKTLRVFDFIVNAVGAVMFVILTWRAVLAAIHAWDTNRISNLLAIPHWPFYCVIALGSGLYAIVQIIEAYRSATTRTS